MDILHVANSYYLKLLHDANSLQEQSQERPHGTQNIGRVFSVRRSSCLLTRFENNDSLSLLDALHTILCAYGVYW